MSSVDNRIVNMQFNNGQFEAGVNQSIGSLNRLKDSLKLEDAATGIDKLNKAANGIDLSGIERGVSSIQQRFTTLGIAGMSAIQNLTSRVIDAGIRMVKGFTIDPIMDGFNELETKNKSITTIMANVGETNTIDQVASALDQLNTYADKTIYNFSQMTENIGRFTAAGVDLNTSVQGIKGLANLGAFFGANNTQVQRAMYQMSQALATGTIKLMDWNSLVQSGMGGTSFSNLLIDVARKQGMAVDDALETYGSFRESLREGWLTNSVFMEALGYFAADVNDANREMVKQAYIEQGWSEEMAEHLVYLGQTATESATKVRSFEQLMDTMNEEVGSSWSTTWDLLLGNYEGATQFWNDLYQAMSPVLGVMNDFRNIGMQSWFNMGGQTMLRTGLNTLFQGFSREALTVGSSVMSVFGVDQFIDAWNQGLNDTIGSTHLGQLFIRLSSGFLDFTQSIQLSETGLKNWGDTWQGISSILDLGIQTVGLFVNGVAQIAGALEPAQEIFLAITGPIGNLVRQFRDWFLSFDPFMNATKGLKDFLTPIHDGLQWIADGLTHGFDVADISSKFQGVLDFIANLGSSIAGIFTGLGEGSGLFQGVSDFFTNIGNKISEFANNLVYGDAIDQFNNRIQQGFQSAKETIQEWSMFVQTYGVGRAFSFMMAEAEAAFAYRYPKLYTDIKRTTAKIGDTFKGLYENVTGYFEGAHSFQDYFNGFKDLSKDLAQDVKSKFTDMGIDTTSVWTGFQSGFQNAVTYVKDHIRNLPETVGTMADRVSEFMARLVDSFKSSSVGTSLSGAFEGIREKVSEIIDWFKEHKADFGDAIKGFLEKLSEGVKNAIPAVIDWFDDFFGRIGEKFSNASKNGIFDRIGQNLGQAGEDIGRGFGSFTQAIGEGFRSVGDLFQGSSGSMGLVVGNIPITDITMIAEMLSLIFLVNQAREFMKTLNTSATQLLDAIKTNKFMKMGPMGWGAKITNSITDFLKSWGGVGGAIADSIRSTSKWAGLSMFLKALLPVLGAVAGLAGIAIADEDAVKLATVSVGGLATLFTVLGRVASAGESVGDFNPNKILDIGQVAISVLGMAAGIWLVSQGVSKLGKLNVDEIEQGMVAVGVIMAGMTTMMGFMAGKHTGVGGKSGASFSIGKDILFSLLGMAVAIKLIAGPISELGTLDTGALTQGMTAVGIIMGGLASMVGLGGRISGGHSFTSNFGTLVGMAASLLMLIPLFKTFAKENWDSITHGLVGMGAALAELSIAIGYLGRVSGKMGGNGLNIKGLGSFAVALLALAGSFKVMQGLSLGDIGKGLLGIGSGLAIFVGATAALEHFTKSSTSATKALSRLAWSVALFGAGFAGFAAFIGALNDLKTGLTGQGIAESIADFVGGVIEGFARIKGKLMAFAVDVIASFLNSLATSAGQLAEGFSRVIISVVDSLTNYIPQIVTSVHSFLTALTGEVKKQFGEFDYSEMSDSIIDMMVTPVMTGLVAKLTNLKWGDIAKVAGSIVLIVGPLVAAMALLSHVGTQEGIDSMRAIQDIITTVSGISAIAGVLVGAGWLKGTDFIKGSAALGAGIDSILAIVGSLMWATSALGVTDEITGSVEAINSIIDVINQFSAAFVLLEVAIGELGGVGAIPSAAIGGAAIGAGIDAVVAVVGSLVAGVGALDNLLGGGLVDSIDKGGDVIGKLGGLFGKIAGEFMGAMDETKSAHMPQAASNIQQAFGNMSPMISELNKMGDAGVNRISTFVDAITSMSGLDPFLADFKSGAFKSFTTMLPDVGTDIAGFANSLAGANLTNLDAGMTVMKDMADFAKDLPNAPDWNIGQWFVGRKQTLSEFTQGLKEFYPEMKSAIDTFGSGDTLDTSGLEKGIEVAGKISDLQNKLQGNQGQSVLSFFVGQQQDLQGFAMGIGAWKTQLQSAIEAFGSGDNLDTSGIEKAITIATDLNDLALKLPPVSSLGSALVGGIPEGLDEFGREIAGMAESLSSIDWSFDNFKPENGFNQAGFDAMMGMVDDLSLAQSRFKPTTSWSVLGMVNYEEGAKDLGEFCESLSQHAPAMSELASTLAGTKIDEAGIGKLGPVTDAIDKLSQAQSRLGNKVVSTINGNEISTKVLTLGEFVKSLNEGDFIGQLQTFMQDVSGYEGAADSSKITAISKAIGDIATAYNSLPPDMPTKEEAEDKIGRFSALSSELTTMTDGLNSILSIGFDEKGNYSENKLNSLQKVSTAISTLATAYEKVSPALKQVGEPNAHGDVQIAPSDIKQTWGNFAEGLSTVGDALRDFWIAAEGLDENGNPQEDVKPIDLNRIQTILDTVTAISDLSTTGALSQLKTDPFKDFKNAIENYLTPSLKDFYKAITDVNGETDGADSVEMDTGKINGILDTVGKLAALGKEGEGSLSGFKTDGFTEFSKAINTDFGESLHNFYSALLGDDGMNFDPTQIQNAIGGIPQLANAFVSLPNITTDTTSRVTALSECISSFIGAFLGGDEEGESLQSRLSSSGGMSQNVADMVTIIGQLSTLASGVTQLSTAFAGIGDIDFTSVESFTGQLSKIMQIFGGGGTEGLESSFDTIGEAGGTYSKGATDISSVITNVQDFATAMGALGTAIASISGAGATGDISGGANTLTQLTTLVDKLSGYDFSQLALDIQAISTAIASLGGGGEMQGPTLSGAPLGGGTSALAQLQSFIDTLANSDISGTALAIQNMATALSTLGGVGAEGGGGALTGIQQMLTTLQSFDFAGLSASIQGFADSLSNVAAGVSAASAAVTAAVGQMIQQAIQRLNEGKEQFNTAGKLAATNYANGIVSGTSGVVSAVGSMVTQAVAKAQSCWSGFYSAGVQAANGMAAGIRSAAAKVASEAAAMVRNAISAAKAAQASASPSKKFMELGVYAGQGYVMGLGSQQRTVEKTTTNMITGALKRAYDLAHNDLTMKPVIEPIVDMSNVKAEANNIEGLLGNMRSTTLARGVSVASSIARRMREVDDGTTESEETPPSTVTYNFTQNNTSPKALSRLEIYRDTRNLFALVKEKAHQ